MSTHARWKLPLGTAGVLVLAVGAWLVFGGQATDDGAPAAAPPAAQT
ncbi:hypothetical protein HMI50_30740, partial [Corallococcus carmarthensis]|nr:hypothetical protein [Corallococcus carmarthensis]